MSPQAAGTAPSPTAFFSYARVDASIVQSFADELRLTGITVLLDTEFLRPGERFEKVILDKVRAADALVFFVSPSSLQSKWVETELLAFSEASNKIVVPVLIGGVGYGDLPRGLARYHGLIVENDSAIPDVARRLAAALVDWQVSGSRAAESEQFSAEAGRRGADLAASIAADIRAPAIDPRRADKSVFLVHGHDHKFRDEAAKYLSTLGIRAVIVSKERQYARSLLDKFEALATQASFAVVLITPDDMGASRVQYENKERGGHNTLKYRARENVILELGFFYGRLGWDHVFMVRKPAEYPWPDFEMPSDLAGAVISGLAGDRDWQVELREKLDEAGLLDTDDSAAGPED